MENKLKTKTFKIVKRVGKVHIREYQDLGYVVVWCFDKSTRKLPVGSSMEGATYIAEKIESVHQLKELLYLDDVLQKLAPDTFLDTPEKVSHLIWRLIRKCMANDFPLAIVLRDFYDRID